MNFRGLGRKDLTSYMEDSSCSMGFFITSRRMGVRMGFSELAGDKSLSSRDS